MLHNIRNLTVCTLFAALTLSGCADNKKHTPQAVPTISGLTLGKVQEVLLPETVDLVGTVKARTSALVSARVAGTVSLLNVREGDRVQKGQLLGRLDAQESLAQATAAFAASDEAEQVLEDALARQKLAQATFNRFKQLYDEQALTRQEFETRQTDLELADQAVIRAKARLRQTEQIAAAAGTMADYTKIVAPISGVIISRQADLGSTVFPGQPLMVIDDESSYQLELAVPESNTGKVKAGTAVQVQIDALDSSASSKITELVPAADPASRTYIAKVPLTMKNLRSGMFGRGAVALEKSAKTLLVPQTAVFERGALTVIWVAGDDRILRMRLVKTGRKYGENIEILSGLDSNEQIVTAGFENAIDGGRLQDNRHE